ncbi:hypothetical protein GCM10011575_44640 [Microlunatus endophyticus]|uniref:CHAD domain-containing protein n=1 Tax=Microlunatus endophyticus TaxID=1716077 RepID=A0A917W934_9ACTN|nr:hypothetical protein [Microlunatus endophyticus]GGL81428.1 hypothetical protein GCM10011575_44640 [Microlunatus endophyticus]
MTKSGPAGEPLLFDLPFTAVPARLDNADLGLARVVALAGRDTTYAAEVTLLDVADHRMIRSGLELAHRVIDGRGDWCLRAPEWQPLLPAERVEPFAVGDLPDDIADIVLPFRRRGALGPVAAISIERQTFEFRAADGDQPLCYLQDDRVTIRRGGVTTARYREITIDPAGSFTAEQEIWLVSAMVAAGGTQIEGFPALATRLGTPATGPTDYPYPRPVDEKSSFETFVEAVLAGRLLELITADLSARGDEPEAGELLQSVVSGLRGDLNGLASALDPDWLAEIDEELGWLVSALEGTSNEGDRVRSVLRRERYLRLLELLVSAVRAPRVEAEALDLPAAETLAGLLADAVAKLIKEADRLGPRSRTEDWSVAALSAEEVARIDGLARMVVAKRDRRAARRLRRPIELLIEARAQAEQGDDAQRQARFSTPADAFELGRAYQRHKQRQAEARDAFLDAWRKAARAGKRS